jgi:hypothetical protein
LPNAARAEVADLLADILGDELPTLLLLALRDEEVAIAAAWARRFGPIATDEQFAAIIRTVRLAQGGRAEEQA